MKKLIIAACGLCFAAGIQAASTDWAVNDIIINGEGDFESFYDSTPATRANTGWAVYLFDNNGATSYSSMQAILSASTFDSTAWKTAMGNYADFGKTVALGDGLVGIETRTANLSGTTSVSGYLLIVDAESYETAQHAFLVDVASSAVSTGTGTADLTGQAATDPTGFGYGNMGYIDARSYTDSNWYNVAAVPEPTSGLLLLLGVAGLALRRRRA